MRQGIYDKAEAALASKRSSSIRNFGMRASTWRRFRSCKKTGRSAQPFSGAALGNAAELQGEATQLIQYKILLTYLLEGKDNMVDSIPGEVRAFARYAGGAVRERRHRAAAQE